MLTVARVAAETAESAASATDRDDADALAAVVTAAAAGARAALARTPEQLEVLRRAGVVDAGGRGVCVLLDALASVVTGAEAEPDRGPGAPGPAGRPGRTWPRSGLDVEDPDRHGPTYEVMYLLDAPADAVPTLRETLAALGDSLVVVGGEPTWNVHVHVDDVGAALEAGVEAGRPHRIRVTHFRDAARELAGELPADSRGVVSVVAGEGLAALFESAGATVVRGGPGPPRVHRRAAHRAARGPGPGHRGAAQRRRQPRGRGGGRGQGPRRGAAGRGHPDPGQRAGPGCPRGARPRAAGSRTTWSP